MNGAQLHLLINHLPILVPLVGTCVLIAGFLVKNDIVKKTALGILVAGAICSVPTYLTGELAENTVKNYPVASQRWISLHEELAEKALYMGLGLGIISMAFLYLMHRGKPIAFLGWAGLGF